jgi:hypothetical protein
MSATCMRNLTPRPSGPKRVAESKACIVARGTVAVPAATWRACPTAYCELDAMDDPNRTPPSPITRDTFAVTASDGVGHTALEFAAPDAARSAPVVRGNARLGYPGLLLRAVRHGARATLERSRRRRRASGSRIEQRRRTQGGGFRVPGNPRARFPGDMGRTRPAAPGTAGHRAGGTASADSSPPWPRDAFPNRWQRWCWWLRELRTRRRGAASDVSRPSLTRPSYASPGRSCPGTPAISLASAATIRNA